MFRGSTKNNPYVKSERPLLGVLQKDYQDTQKTSHITFGKTAEGKHIARMTQNGHEFVATHPESAMKAAAAVQQAVTKADDLGKTAVPKR